MTDSLDMLEMTDTNNSTNKKSTNKKSTNKKSTNKKSKELNYPAIVSQNKHIVTNDGEFSSVKWVDRNNNSKKTPISVIKETVLGTKSYCGVNESEMKDSNPANIERVNLFNKEDTLAVEFEMKFLGNIPELDSCGNEMFKEKVFAIIDKYIKENGVRSLVERYVHNIVNGRWLWRNRNEATEVETRVSYSIDSNIKNELVFNALKFSLRNFNTPPVYKEEIDILISLIENSFIENKILMLDIVGFAKMGNGFQVYPSELFNTKSKEKLLYKIYNKEDKPIAGFSSQKIGNAIRTIDIGYDDFNYYKIPIAIDPYSSGHRIQFNFFDLFKDWIINDIPPPNEEHKLYIIASLIRGGLYGWKAEKNKKSETESETEPEIVEL